MQGNLKRNMQVRSRPVMQQVEENRSGSSDSDDINSQSFRLRPRRLLYANKNSKKKGMEKAELQVEPSQWRGTYNVYSKDSTNGGFVKIGHPMFIDTEVGWRPAESNCLQEHRQDDDVDTDEEIFDQALKACSRDFNDVRRKLDRQPVSQLINNFEIQKRCAHPESYDRNGKFCEEARLAFHPSMNMLQIAKVAQSEKHTKLP